MNIAVHGIHPQDTVAAPTFEALYPEIRARLQDSTLVAHNEVFDRSVLKRTMEHHALDYTELDKKFAPDSQPRIFEPAPPKSQWDARPENTMLAVPWVEDRASRTP